LLIVFSLRTGLRAAKKQKKENGTSKTIVRIILIDFHFLISSLSQTTADKIFEQNLLNWWVEKHGTKLGNLMMYLRRLWYESPKAKVIIFSQVNKLREERC
jgi:hypothetical protein